MFRGSWAMINYSFTFYNSALIALVETEVPSSSTIHSDHNSIGYFIKNILPFILPDKQEKKESAFIDLVKQTRLIADTLGILTSIVALD